MLSTIPRLTSALALAALLAGCTTMSPQECKTANWQDVGHRDGRDGKSLTMLETRTSDCAEAGVRVDSTAYLRGRDTGLRSFCRIENAGPLGLNGGSYEGVCPPQVDAEFRRHFQAGRAVYSARAEVNRIDNSIHSKEQRLRTIDRDEERRVRDANKDEDRRRIRREIDDERHRIRDELRDLDRQRHRARERLRDAEWSLDRVQNGR